MSHAGRLLVAILAACTCAASPPSPSTVGSSPATPVAASTAPSADAPPAPALAPPVPPGSPGTSGAPGPAPLPGFYQLGDSIGSGYSRFYGLFRDGRWIQGDEYPCWEDGPVPLRVEAQYGRWTADEAGIRLTVLARDVTRHATCVCNDAFCSLEGGQRATERVEGEVLTAARATACFDGDTRLPCFRVRGEAEGFHLIGDAESYLAEYRAEVDRHVPTDVLVDFSGPWRPTELIGADRTGATLALVGIHEAVHPYDCHGATDRPVRRAAPSVSARLRGRAPQQVVALEVGWCGRSYAETERWLLAFDGARLLGTVDDPCSDQLLVLPDERRPGREVVLGYCVGRDNRDRARVYGVEDGALVQVRDLGVVAAGDCRREDQPYDVHAVIRRSTDGTWTASTWRSACDRRTPPERLHDGFPTDDDLRPGRED